MFPSMSPTWADAGGRMMGHSAGHSQEAGSPPGFCLMLLAVWSWGFGRAGTRSSWGGEGGLRAGATPISTTVTACGSGTGMSLW